MHGQTLGPPCSRRLDFFPPQQQTISLLPAVQEWCRADSVASIDGKDGYATAQLRDKDAAYRDALSRGKELKAFFKNQPLREISTRDCERSKSMLGKAETLRNELRSGSTVNRYMALLSGVCKRAILFEHCGLFRFAW